MKINFQIPIVNYQFRKGFTILELLIVMAIIGILASVIVFAINPGRQLAKARDTERQSEITALLSAVMQYASEHNGDLPDTDGDPDTNNFPTSAACIGTDLACFDLAGAGETGETIVPEYMVELPTDPKFADETNPQSDTGYSIYVDANGHLHASAVGEVTASISVAR
ncbi:hypothetical protein A2159_00985 [Candidatus Woesebacteria bacterium RBG_13_34_9]|uniref:Type II secretion system protein GspG C-terminal domain-containing protein n=1 Tax=Candidatus Woesebacteria bacterium RBG_13_34_9 TaxID=1802477 RepID=A0A1F7X543_9BACT|nr:MAG: hypothetical protein A2159_00985 [Candidatus Woesebacteria bacterium RBG_13_34_9]